MALTQWQLKPVATDTIASGDFLAFTDEDETGDPINKLTVDNLMETGIPLVTEDAIADGDYILFLDGGASGNTNKEAVHDLATLFAGAGMTATSSVLNVIGGDGITANANDIAVTAAQTTITSLLATAIKIGEDSQTIIDFETANEIHFDADNAQRASITSAGLTMSDDTVINLGEAGKIDFGDEEPADDAATGIVFSFLAGATLAIGDVVYMGTDGEVLEADANQVTTMPAIGICVSAGSDGNACDVLVQGIMHDTSAFPTFTVGADIFVSAAATGAVVDTAPSGSGDTVQKVGVALHADMVYFNFNTTEVLLA
jgi:hypothetical protein